ncbi:double-strand break repair protein AddB [Acetobacteraceae bacterium KSS8]|uniref:Double-strand break repair protein AddB n=1 Tax=Endosaccharibacter trunci TaxID=2812733 RepID=A0ABT1WA46_9PROT|nr:double-strand break repair protein AddB [Acetobacteraceae bacterium KSS8]
MTPNLATIPLHLPFLDVLARRWLAEHARAADPLAGARGTILLPTRRAARALGEAFLRASGGNAMLQPRIAALGALDEAPLALGDWLDAPPAIGGLDRLALLSGLVLQAGTAFGTAPTLDQAWGLAQALADLMDEAERAGCDLAATLPDAAEEQAEHWQLTLRFLRIVTEIWPTVLAERGQGNPVARQMALLEAQSRLWREQPPASPIWAAGFTALSPAATVLLNAIARLPNGMLVLPGLDDPLDDAHWQTLPDSHPQAGLARLLAELGARRADFAIWGKESEPVVPETRVAALGRALLPQQALGDWLRRDEPVSVQGLRRLHTADQQEEAAAIALLLRDAIETPNKRAALVTPDRGLARRVAVELFRWGVAVDDSAGEPLAGTPPALLLRLAAATVADGLSPVSLLSLLKHPLCAAGLHPAECRRQARALELAVLRGPAPAPGGDGLREAVQDRAGGDASLSAFVARVLERLQPLSARFAQRQASVPALLRALLEAAEALAATEDETGAAILWSGEDGNALALHLAELSDATESVPPQAPRVLPGLLDASLQGIAVRSRRALRGLPDGATEHPRVFIWGLLEARLQTADLLVLGGLAETAWPPAVDPGPWMSRPMRKRVGLPSPEEVVGQAAHDFLSCCCSAPNVVLSCPGRREGAPSVPARWLVRLDAFLQGQNQALPVDPAGGWLRLLDQPDGPPKPVSPPEPRPPLALRPRRLSITEIETWMRDPYAIHARHVLRFRPLPELEQAADAADYGLIVHEALAQFFAEHGTSWPPNAAQALGAAFDRALTAARLRPALAAWWRPRLRRIAAWVAEAESERRREAAPLQVHTEIAGRVTLDDAPGGPFVLSGRADRIDLRADRTLALFDYKTGTLPGKASVQAGWSSQLVLEAAMALRGAFGEALRAPAGEIIYWRLSGGHVPGEESRPVAENDLQSLVEQCWRALHGLIAAYDDPEQPYLSHPRPEYAPPYPDYAQLARVAEWSAAREEGG